MADYEVEFDAFTEHRDARSGSVHSVDVSAHVQRADAAVPAPDATGGSYEVSFEVEDGTATFDEVSGDRFDDLALVAVRAAADELAGLGEYEVADPFAAADGDYEVFDQLP